MRERVQRWIVLWLLAAGGALAQQTVAPTPEPVGSPRGENAGGYNVLNSFETGYRFRSVSGDEGKYRSDVNFGNGVRLLGGTLEIHSRDGHGRWFDELLLRTQGLGNDPYEFSSLRIGKNRWYRYDMSWRLNEYYNPALPVAYGDHFLNTQRRMQDHDLTILPESPFKLFVGYSRNIQDGPALSTTQVFDSRGDEFPLFSNVHRLENEYRLGGEANLFGTRFTFLHGWVNYSETTPYALPGPSVGLDAQDRTTLDQFQRAEPYRGSSPFWRLNLQRQSKLWSVGARWTYAGSRRSFFFNEIASGTDFFGLARARQALITGNASRPVSAGDLTLSLFPAAGISVTNQTSYDNTRMNGNNLFTEVNNQTLLAGVVNFQFLGIRAVVNSTDLNVRAAKWIALYGGYRFSTRRIQSVEGDLRASQNNDLHSGLAGVRFQPLKPLAINLEGEIGRASRPIYPISDRNYHVLGARVEYKRKSLALGASARANYNVNSISLAEFSSRARNYSANASWAPKDWLAFDAVYTRLHLDTLSALAYFANGDFITGDRSIYISNIHSGNVVARFGISSRADLSVGYSRVQDVGGNPRGGSTLPVFVAAQTFPLTFESPLARFSLKLHDKIRWNIGYQFYHYLEELRPQRYHAHTAYSSVLWSF